MKLWKFCKFWKFLLNKSQKDGGACAPPNPPAPPTLKLLIEHFLSNEKVIWMSVDLRWHRKMHFIRTFLGLTDSSRGLKCKTFCKMCSCKNSAKNLQKFCRFFCKIFATFLQLLCNFFLIFLQIFCKIFCKFFANFFAIFFQNFCKLIWD